MNINLSPKTWRVYMQLMSKITVAFVTSILTLSSAMAEVTLPVAVPSPQTTNMVDLSYAFGDSQDLQIQAMTQQEMENTEGAWALPGAVAGAGMGAWNYMGNAAVSGQFKWSGLATNVAAGAVVGSFGPVVGLGRYYAGSRIWGAAGVVNGIIHR